MTNNSAKSFSPLKFVLSWAVLLFLFGGVGYAVNGYTGLVIAVGVPLVVAIRAWMVRNTLVHQSPDPELVATLSRFSSVSRSMSKAIPITLLFFLIYAAILTAAYNSQAAANWMNVLQPLADWLSSTVPALRRSVATTDAVSWTQATQHVLMCGWILCAAFAVWICFSVFVADRDAWRKVLSKMSARRLLGLALAALVLCVFFGLILYFGISPKKGPLSGSLKLFSLALLFSVALLAFWAFVISTGAFLATLSEGRSSDAKAQ